MAADETRCDRCGQPVPGGDLKDFGDEMICPECQAGVEELMRSAVERLRDATTNRRAIGFNVVDAGREGGSKAEAFDHDAATHAILNSGALLRDIEDQAIRALNEVYAIRIVYGDVVQVIEAAEAEWIYSEILTRAVETTQKTEGGG